MKTFNRDPIKNKKMSDERNISFDEVLYFIQFGNVIDIIEHPNKEKYPNQKMFAIDISDYVYLVPFVESETEIFLKTIIPSRKATKQYLKEKGNPL